MALQVERPSELDNDLVLMDAILIGNPTIGDNEMEHREIMASGYGLAHSGHT